jgi:hypothetical protein
MFQFRPDAAFLLCSDGLTDTVPSAEIAAIIETYDGDAELVSRRLVDAANEAGGKDNVSVVFVAGPEFEGAESAGARRRHAITRPRVNRWTIARSRGLWLLAGILTGVALWASLNRVAPPFGASPSGARGARRTALASSEPRAIAKALSVAQPGDTIEIPPGEYLGPIELRDDISVISPKEGAALIRLDPAAVADAGIAFAARGIHRGRLSGFRIASGGDAPMATGILLDGADLEIDDVEISGAGDCAIRIVARSAPVIRASDLHDNPGCGVWIGGESSPRLVGNRIARNGTAEDAPRAGVEIHPPAAPILERNMILGNGLPNLEEQIQRANITAESQP